MPPARSGIATSPQAVLEGLERIGYTPGKHKIQPYWPIKHQHWATVPWHTMGVYHLGNNMEFHGDIYDLAIRTPGLLVIHDLALDDFVMGMVATAQPFGHQALREGLLLAPRLHGFEEAERNEPLRVPYVAHAARNARGIVVHSPFVERYLRAFGCKTPIFCRPAPGDRERAARPEGGERRSRDPRVARVDGDGDAMIGVFGDQNAAKLIDVVLEAMVRLPQDAPRAGRASHPRVRRRADGAGSGLGARVSVHTDVSDEDLAWMCAADVAVDLRYPHRGEVSGSLSRSMQVGRPDGRERDRDLPRPARGRGRPRSGRSARTPGARRRAPNACRRSRTPPPDRRRPGALGGARPVRGDRSRLRRGDGRHDWPSCVTRPRRALARWGGALVGPRDHRGRLSEGYGMAYARALDEFRPSSSAAPSSSLIEVPAGTRAS